MKSLSLRLAACILLGASLVLVACQSTKSSTASKMLRFNFENGKGYDYEMNMSMDQSIQGAGPVKMDMLFYYSLDVTGEEGELKNVRARYDRFKMKMAVMGMNLDVDTDNPPKTEEESAGNPLAMMDKMFGAIKGKEFNMKINREGKVLEVTGFKEMVGSMLDSMGLKDQDREEAMKQFEDQFSDEKSKAQFERLLYIFPNKEVKIGDSWNRSTSGSGMTYNSKYTVKEIEGDMVTLDEESEVESDRGGKHIKGELTGTVVVDSRSGLIVKADQDLEMKNESPAFTLHLKTSVKGKAR